ncbi:hypothetical protein llap_6131 [Limosa lapponica baueri]|uniref:Sister chromatid cohesion protein pds5 n=1 Tax=Limosa lapponica baueri TaxID=1758121 RepID=A0A2I0UBZ0_LIMLA|nr:hypothetical protein llap_6131 [Limosa lapponica baueri]
MAHSKTRANDGKITYPPGVKEISDKISKEEMVRRLKMVVKTFMDMDQDSEEEKELYLNLALHLASDFFLKHPDKDVRLLVACCLADIFRIYAPEAPYTSPDKLKDIFMFITRQLKGLEDTKSPQFNRYFYLLENIAWVKSYNICFELEDSNEIFTQLYRTLFSVINNGHNQKVHMHMVDLMSSIICEGDTVSQELLDTVLVNLVPAHKNLNKQAYDLAKALLKRTAQAIEPYITNFFNQVLMLGKTSISDLSEHVFDLILELYNIDSHLLLSVLPQLEFKLKSNDNEERLQVVKLLAKMFGAKDSELASQNKPLWQCYLGRFNDIHVPIRLECVKFASHCLMNHPDLAKDLTEYLKVRSHDPEEAIRHDVIVSIVTAAKKDLLLVNDHLLNFVRERTLDKRWRVRKEAMMGLAQVYKKYSLQSEAGKEAAKQISWIKDKLLHIYYQNSIDDRLLVERIFAQYMVPHNLETNERMKCLYYLYATLDSNAVNVSITEETKNVLRNFPFLSIIISPNLDRTDIKTDASSKAIFSKVMVITRNLPDPGKAQDFMKKFTQVLEDDEKIRSQLEMLVSPTCSCKQAEGCVLPGKKTTKLWVPDEEVSPETLVKIQAIKMMVRWLLGMKNNHSKSGTSTLRLLTTILHSDGDLTEQGKISKPDMSRLRLAAGNAIVKLAQEPCYHEIITLEQYQLCALAINDECYQVRQIFAQKLHKGLSRLRLPLEYMAICALCAKDPVKERRAHARQCLVKNINVRREYLKQHAAVSEKLLSLLPEYVVPYTIHLLAHDPDYVKVQDIEQLKDIKECLWFILEILMAKNENNSHAFIRKMVENIKQTKDAQGPEDPKMNEPKAANVLGAVNKPLSSAGKQSQSKSSRMETVSNASSSSNPSSPGRIKGRLDSTEMDHSENEEFTLASPLPGKKTDKRDDSDLVRSEMEKPRGRKKAAITDSEEKLSIDDLNKLGQEQKLRGSQRGRKRPAVVSESDETQWQEEKRLKEDVIESEDEQNSPPKKGRRGRPPKANNGGTPKEEPVAKSSKRSKKKQPPAAAAEEEEEEEERQTENIEQKPKGRQNRTQKRTQQSRAGRSKQAASKENESSEEMDVFQSNSPVSDDIPQEEVMEEEEVSTINGTDCCGNGLGGYEGRATQVRRQFKSSRESLESTLALHSQQHLSSIKDWQ